MLARILIIEDDPADLEAMVYQLRMAGYFPRSARDGLEGLTAARQDPPDLILCGMHMAGMEGHEILRHLRRQPATQSVPVVAVGAPLVAGDQDCVLAHEFDRYFAKPIDPETFVAQVETFIPLRAGKNT